MIRKMNIFFGKGLRMSPESRTTQGYRSSMEFIGEVLTSAYHPHYISRDDLGSAVLKYFNPRHRESEWLQQGFARATRVEARVELWLGKDFRIDLVFFEHKIRFLEIHVLFYRETGKGFSVGASFPANV